MPAPDLALVTSQIRYDLKIGRAWLAVFDSPQDTAVLEYHAPQGVRGDGAFRSERPRLVLRLAGAPARILADMDLTDEGDDGGGTNAGKAYLVVAADLSTSGGSTDLGTAFCSFQGEAARDYAGDALSSAGDVDADGYADLLIGAAENDAAGADAGKAYLVLGASLGSGGSLSLAGADIAIVGAAANDATGRSVADAGDVDGDGRDDILVGAPGNDTEGSNAGVTYLIFGVTLSAAGASLDMAAADYDYVYLGDDDDDYAGFATSGAGDVNGDGYADMLFGAYGVSSEFGRVYLWPSPGD